MLQAGVKQREVARQLNVHESTISRLMEATELTILLLITLGLVDQKG